MIIQPFLPSGHVFFCDDVRQEINGKRTFVGVYTGVMYINAFPGTLATFSAAITYREAPEATGKVIFRMFFEGQGEDRLLAELAVERPEELALKSTDEFTMAETHLIFTIAPFEIPHEGRVKVRAYKDGDEIRMGSMRILQMPEPMAEQD